MEIPYGRFRRSVRLPPCPQVERIEARYEEGFLLVEIPKQSETKKA